MERQHKAQDRELVRTLILILTLTLTLILGEPLVCDQAVGIVFLILTYTNRPSYIAMPIAKGIRTPR